MNLHYLIQEPAIKLEKNPLIVLLHGYGSNEEDLFVSIYKRLIYLDMQKMQINMLLLFKI